MVQVATEMDTVAHSRLISYTSCCRRSLKNDTYFSGHDRISPANHCPDKLILKEAGCFWAGENWLSSRR